MIYHIIILLYYTIITGSVDFTGPMERCVVHSAPCAWRCILILPASHPPGPGICFAPPEAPEAMSWTVGDLEMGEKKGGANMVFPGLEFGVMMLHDGKSNLVLG